MGSLTRSHLLRLSAECVLTLVLLLVAINFFKIFKQHVKRGFFCDDESLKYPYKEDTMGGKAMLFFLSLYLPAIFIILCESIVYLLQRTRTTSDKENRIIPFLLSLHYNLTSFACGFALHAFFVHAAKISVGRLRPHFFAVCQPYRRLDGSTCDNPKNHGIYIKDYDCQGEDDPYITNKMLFGVYQSFPSGHSSFIFYGMIFFVCYLHRFAKALRQNYRINVGLFMLVIQMLCVLLAWFIAVSRVMDYKHHWSDVLVGILLGTSVAVAVTLYASQQLKSVNSWPEGVKSSSSSFENSEKTSTVTLAATMPNAISEP